MRDVDKDFYVMETERRSIAPRARLIGPKGVPIPQPITVVAWEGGQNIVSPIRLPHSSYHYPQETKVCK